MNPSERIRTPEAAQRAVLLIAQLTAEVSAHVSEVLRATWDQSAGYSQNASGSGSIGGGGSNDSSTERSALNPTHDNPTFDRLRYWAGIENALAGISAAAQVTGTYKLRAPRASDGRVMHELETECSNCRTHGHRTAKAPGRALCNFCEEKKRDHGHLPDAELLEVKRQGKRCTPEVIGLFINRCVARAKEAEQAKGKKRKAA